MVKDGDYWIEKLVLAEHQEGGYFRRVHRSMELVGESCLPERYKGPRVFSTSIYYLLKGDQFSALHRIKSDEIWHFYAGSGLTIYVIDAAAELSELKLGRDPEKGEEFQRVVEAGCWFGAVGNDPRSYSLVGCTVAPGFEFDDFELGERKDLMARYPRHRSVIERLTR
jgi:uncharacterized protein